MLVKAAPVSHATRLNPLGEERIQCLLRCHVNRDNKYEI